MSIYSHKRDGKVVGTLLIDRVILGRRVRKATGLPDTKNGRRTAKAYDAMIDDLIARRRSDLVMAWLGDQVTLHEVHAYYSLGADLPAAGGLKPLRPLVQAWLDGDISPSHRRSTDSIWTVMLRDTSSQATLDDLPGILEAERKRCEKVGAARTFGKARAAALALVRDTVGQHSSPLWRTLADIKLLKVTKAKRPPPTLDDAFKAAQQVIQPYRDMWRMMLMTGMGPDELLHGVWHEEEGGIRIAGTKRAARDRLVPLVRLLPVGLRSDQMLAKAIRPFGLQPYDGRRVYAQVMELVGIPRSRRKAYMGHAAGDVTDLYERPEVRKYLNEDAERLRAALGPIFQEPDVLPNDGVPPAKKARAQAHRRQVKAPKRRLRAPE